MRHHSSNISVQFTTEFIGIVSIIQCMLDT